MGTSTPTEAAPPYEDLFHERGANSSNGYAIVGQIDVADEHRDVEQGHRHNDGPTPFEMAVVDNDPNQHSHCSECDRQRERRERRESAQKSCGMVAKTFILIALFLTIFGIVGIEAWKDVCLKRPKSHH